MSPPDRYLRTSLLVVRHPGGSVLLHPGSSVVLLVDPMGAQVAARLIRGKSETEVRLWVESRMPDTGAGERVAQLIDRLQTIGAITTSRPDPTGVRLAFWMIGHSIRGFQAEWRSPGEPVAPQRLAECARGGLPGLDHGAV